MGFQLFEKRDERVAAIATACEKLAARIEERESALIAALTKYESHETARDEIWRSLDCLRNVSKEMESLSVGHVDLTCSFLPVNLPLYSLVIFAIIPGFMSDKLIIRPPVLMKDLMEEIWTLLDAGTMFPAVRIADMSRRVFTDAYVSCADVILFTGRYDNALSVQMESADALFIYNGAGVNPVVVTETAEIALAVEKTIEMRVFNSGQDCAGSDIIFVHERIAEDFTDKLLQELTHVKVGSYSDPEVRVGPIVKVDQISEVNEFLEANAHYLLSGGTVDMEAGIVYPSVLKKDIDDIMEFPTTEFFSPIFYLVVYHKLEDLRRFFMTDAYSDHAMYVTVFGEDFSLELDTSIVLLNKIVNDVERGYLPYGGFGPKANYVSYHGMKEARPLRISTEIAKHLERLAAK